MRKTLTLVALFALLPATWQPSFAVESGPGSSPSAGSGSGSGPSPGKSGPPIVKFAGPVIFAMALGNDQPTNSAIAVALSNRLKDRVACATADAHCAGLTIDPKHPPLAPRIMTADVVPEGTWNLDDFVAQCATDPANTIGAFIALPATTGGHSADYLVLLRNETVIQFSAMIAECGGSAAAPGETRIVWVSGSTEGEYGRSAIQFLPFAVLTSVYLAFAPQRTYQTVTTTAYATPNPLPSTGARSSVQTTNASVLNASGSGSLQQQVITSVTSSQLQFGPGASAPHLTLHAADDAVGKLLTWFDVECRRAAPPSNYLASKVAEKTARDFCTW